MVEVEHIMSELHDPAGGCFSPCVTLCLARRLKSVSVDLLSTSQQIHGATFWMLLRKILGRFLILGKDAHFRNLLGKMFGKFRKGFRNALSLS